MKGAGGYYNDEWFIYQWEANFLEENNPSINYLELFALTAAVLTWGNQFKKNCKVIIFCDNQSVIHMVNNNSSKCAKCMILIRILVIFIMKHNIKLKVKYVKSADNTYADLLSRLNYKEFRAVARRNGKKFSQKPRNIPAILSEMMEKWT